MFSRLKKKFPKRKVIHLIKLFVHTMYFIAQASKTLIFFLLMKHDFRGLVFANLK